jgi:heme-degrading monooxygenase HmoA
MAARAWVRGRRRLRLARVVAVDLGFPRDRDEAAIGGHMVIREWRDRAASGRSDAYPKHFSERVLPELQSVAGFRGAELCRREVGDRVEFLVLTRWESMVAVRAFPGPDAERAVVEPGAVAALVDFDQRVRHYVVIAESSARL